MCQALLRSAMLGEIHQRHGRHTYAFILSVFLRDCKAISNSIAATEESGAVVTYDKLPTVMGDPSQLSGLFQNLIGNVIKYRSKKNPQIHISAERKGNEWVFSVHDNGIGIDPDFRVRIFAIFQRLHTIRDRVQE
jgi:light-regulated signal transduction histidine kinase (bacteriophytochrome)